MTDHLPDFDSLWEYDDPNATEDAFRALLPVARATCPHRPEGPDP